MHDRQCHAGALSAAQHVRGHVYLYRSALYEDTNTVPTWLQDTVASYVSHIHDYPYSYMPIIGRTHTSGWPISNAAGFLRSSVIIRLLALAATCMGPSACEDKVRCCRRKAKLLASRPLDFGDIHPKQPKLVTCERASEDLREVDHRDPFEWSGHRSAILLPQPN